MKNIWRKIVGREEERKSILEQKEKKNRRKKISYFIQ
jgi:hypothetical protein